MTIRRREGFEPERMSDKISDKKERFYRILMENLNAEGYVTTRSMAEVSGMAPSATKHYLTKLYAQGVITQTGKNRNVKYQKA